MPQPAQRVLNYVTANRFYVEIENQITASFSGCDGLGVKAEHTVIKEGGMNTEQRILLGRASFDEVTLKRGLSDDEVFWSWALQGVVGTGDFTKRRRNVNILVYNQAGEMMRCWTLIGAVPKAWKGPNLTATSGEVAIESLTLMYEGLKASKQGGGGATLIQSGRDSTGFFPSN